MWWIVGAAVFGEIIGFIIAAVVSGRLDDFEEWRAKENEKKRMGDHRHHDSDGNRRSGGGNGS